MQAEAQQTESVDAINQWAAEVTNGLIKMAVPPGTPFDVILTNAVYFKVSVQCSRPALHCRQGECRRRVDQC